MNGPIWKVPYSAKKKGQYATIEEVQAALPADVEGLTVEDFLGYPNVRFPDKVSNETMKQVKQHLESQGFEVS